MWMSIWTRHVPIISAEHFRVWITASPENIQSIFFPGTWTRTSPTPMCQRIILPIMREHIISSRMRTTRLISGHLIRMMVDLPFPHNGSYLEYNADDQLYYYSEYGKAHVDPGNDNAQLCFKNLLIQSCGYTQYDEHGYMIFDCISSGYGYYVTNGKALYVSWKKTSMTSPTRYYDAQGNEITINTGKTYVALVPVDDWEDLVIE